MKLIVYMPAFNEQDTIVDLIRALPTDIDSIDDIMLLVVDDGSSDSTAALAAAAGARVLSHPSNSGVGAALQTAVQYALTHGADILVSIDADGQFDPSEMPRLLAPILERRADLVIGNRFADGRPAHMSALKFWGNRQIAALINSATRQNFADVSCGYRAYNREALLHLGIFGTFTYTHETILSLVYQGLTVADCPIHVSYDPLRTSRVARSLWRYAAQSSGILLRVLLDYRPIRVFGSIALGFLLIGALLEVFLFIHYLATHSFTPYKSVGFVGLGFVIFGMLVLLIALLADMLNRIRLRQEQTLYMLRRREYDRLPRLPSDE